MLAMTWSGHSYPRDVCRNQLANYAGSDFGDDSSRQSVSAFGNFPASARIHDLIYLSVPLTRRETSTVASPYLLEV